MPIAAIISSVVDIGSATAQTISNISDQKKRANLESALANLDKTEKEKLENKILRAQTQNEKIAIISKSIIDSKLNEKKLASAEETKLATIILGGAISLLIAVLLVKNLMK
jgi:hypothetical protein